MSLAQTNYSNIMIRIDEGDKKGFEKFCKGIGMNMSTAITVFIKACLREQKIPFELSISENNKRKITK